MSRAPHFLSVPFPPDFGTAHVSSVDVSGVADSCGLHQLISLIHTVSNAHTCYDDPSNAVEKMAELSLSSERTLSVLLLLLLLSSDGDIPHYAGTRGRNPRVCLQVSLHPGLSPVNISVKILKAALPLLCFGSNPLGRTAGAAPDLVSCCPLPPLPGPPFCAP